MEFNVHRPDGTWIGIIEDFESAIWRRAYYETGDFELRVPASADLLSIVEKDGYITRNDDDTLMIIEALTLTTNGETGDSVTIKGRTASALLDRRVIWAQTTISGRVDAGVYKIINENALAPADPDRALPIAMDPPDVLADKIDTQHTGTNLLAAVQEICTAHDMGFRAVRDNIAQVVARIELYMGVDHRAAQSENAPVIFSPEYENLLSTSYAYDMTIYKNVALIAGEGEGLARKRTVAGTAAGLQRREMYVDARDLSTNGGEIAEADYLTQLETRGLEKLAETQISEAFDGELDTENTYQYRRDYDVGDLVTIENEYGMRADVRIVQIIESWSESGAYSITPIFEGMEG